MLVVETGTREYATPRNAKQSQANKQDSLTRFHRIDHLPSHHCNCAANIEREMAPPPSGKRKFDTIDLTGDDDAGSSSQPHRAPPGDVTQSQRDSWLEQGDEADAEDIVLSSQDGDDSVTQSYQLYGMLRIGTRLTTPY